jgi:SdrD B-like protein
MRNYSHSRKTTAMLMAAGCLSIFIGTLAAQQPPPAPAGIPSLVPDVSAQRCDSVVGGTVARRVGNLYRGPSRPAGLKGVQVQLLDVNGNRISEVRTDRDGRFAFRDLCGGRYTVCPGTPCPAGGAIQSLYEPESQDVRVPPIVQRVEFLRVEPPPVVDKP